MKISEIRVMKLGFEPWMKIRDWLRDVNKVKKVKITDTERGERKKDAYRFWVQSHNDMCLIGGRGWRFSLILSVF